MNCLGVVYRNCWTSFWNIPTRETISSDHCDLQCKWRIVRSFLTMRLCKPQSNLRQFLGISQNSLFLLHQAIGGSWPFWGRVQNAHIYGTGPQRASVSCWLTYKPPIFCCFSYCSSISNLPQQLHVMRTHTCVPIAPHGSHICIYVRDDGSIVMRGRWQCKCDPGPEPHATTLCKCIELSARAGGLQRGVCVIFAIYITTARDRIELRHCLKWGGYLFLNLIVLKLQLAKLLKYEKCLQLATSETKWKCYENKMFIHRKY